MGSTTKRQRTASSRRSTPTLAARMAHWGLAYALGPNYNKPWEAFDQADLTTSVSRAFQATADAASPAAGAAPVERALVHALAARYPSAEPSGDGSAWNAGYADAMRGVYRAFPDDLDVAALFADALMNLTPWALWDQITGEPADGAATIEAKAVLDRALADPEGRDHPGVLHLYIHLMEMSARPEDALQAADRLSEPGPGRGPPAAHAHASRRAVRRLPAGGVREHRRDRGRREVPRAARRDELLHAVPGAQLSLQDLRSDVPGPGADRAGHRRPARRRHPGRTAPGRSAADGGLAGGVRADEDARPDPVRPLGRHHRRATARRPGAVLRDHGDAALRQGPRARGHRADRRGRPSISSSSRPRWPGCPTRAPCSTTPARTSCR